MQSNSLKYLSNTNINVDVIKQIKPKKIFLIE